MSLGHRHAQRVVIYVTITGHWFSSDKRPKGVGVLFLLLFKEVLASVVQRSMG